ncbi:hypothetical protein FPOA_03403 [Fusarium poae]|uniref:Uncharacterized protein n=1 Tax=Fusarium poae TaxID=36050 RepID=A0A1B8B9R8_FUSPO|nr:hypothetical protein FPOA_03403 [Fusarium poae]
MATVAGVNGMKDMIKTQLQHEKEGRPPSIHPGGWKIGAAHADNSPIISGHTFTITMSEEDARRCKMMLDLQWFMMSIAAMSGAAGYPELLPPPDGRHELNC